MRVKGRADEACRRCERLELAATAGDVPSAQDRAFLAAHRAQCEPCRTAAAAAALMAHTDDAGPARPLDELSRRRFVNTVVAQATVDGPLEATPGVRLARRGWPRWQWIAAAAVLLAAGLGLALGLTLRRGTGAGASARRPGAALVMRSGEVVVEGAPAQSALAGGKTLRVRRGQAALALPDDAYVLLDEHSTVRVVRLSGVETTLHLEQGWLLAVVQPKRHRRRFTVTTRAGRVEVTGTVFTVRVTPDRVAVAVLRGQLRVVEPARPVRRLVRGQTGALGGDDRQVRAVAPAAERAAMARAAILGLLGVGEAARLDVRSQPTGALVLVDGVALGRTPLAARLRTGHRRLEVLGKGRTPVREQLTLRSGDRVDRDFELSPVTVSVWPLGRPRPAAGSLAAAPSPEGVATVEPSTEVFPPVIIPRAAPDRRPAEAGAPGAVTARDLLRRAQMRRVARDWRGAAESYRLLLKRFPASSAARAAQVALGLLQLDHLGNAAGALRLLEAYLRATRRGVLAQEAAYGRIRALRRLGRRNAERRALASFLRYYPGALQAPLVKQRLGALTAPAPTSPPAP